RGQACSRAVLWMDHQSVPVEGTWLDFRGHITVRAGQSGGAWQRANAQPWRLPKQRPGCGDKPRVWSMTAAMLGTGAQEEIASIAATRSGSVSASPRRCCPSGGRRNLGITRITDTNDPVKARTSLIS